MKKLINIPDKIHDILENHKETTGRPVSGMILEAIYKWMIHEKLLNVKRVNLIVDQNGEIHYEKDVKKEKEKINKPPESVKFCDGDKCEVNF